MKTKDEMLTEIARLNLTLDRIMAYLEERLKFDYEGEDILEHCRKIREGEK